MNNQLFSTTYQIDEISAQWLTEKSIQLYMARLDKIHPVVSGNKLFKLQPYLTEMHHDNHTVVTMGGTFSNHLVATAFYCQKHRLPAIGIVRGEVHEPLSHTLQHCQSLGMQLVFISREKYRLLNAENFKDHFPHFSSSYIFIPEGGYGTSGADGAAAIFEGLKSIAPTHVATSIGTGTTLAGLVKSAPASVKILGFSALKGLHDIHERLHYLLNLTQYQRPEIFQDFHFGGYAKYNQELILFMNSFYKSHQIPLDFVYTGKLMYGLLQTISTNYFPAGSRIIALHTGGLQGNLSLSPGLLDF